MSIDSSESRGGVTLRNVNFAYHADDTGHVSGQTGEQLLHLNDICLHIEQGAYVAVTGPSGSGKSTLGKIIAGLLFPAEGQIRVGGRNPLEDAANARSMVAYVPQVTALFTGSIRDNLVLGRTDISYETMVHAAKLAQLHEFIEQLPQGYDTDIKEQGASMSGGQKQRLAIARAVLADRPIWVLDEATSALDIDTEREVISAITKEARKRNRTIISIAHRMTSVQDADCIIVMDNGCIRQQGTHHDLLDGEDSLYRQLWGYKTA